MSVFPRPAVRAFGLILVVTGVAGAQGAAQKECSVNEDRPTQIGKATIAIQVAQSTQDPNAAARQLTAAVKGLTENGERLDNQVGRNFVLGKALVLWTLQPNVELVARRGSLGYTTMPDAQIDLAAAIDTAFKVVETANPECIAETSRWRGQKAWVNLVNKAIEKLNAEELDSAQFAAERAILLNPWGPYGYVVMGNVLQRRSKGTEAFAMYRKSADVAARDTLYDDIRRQSLIYLGNAAADSAEMAEGAAKKPYVDIARQAFEQIAADKAAGPLASTARSGMCRIAIASGDTASLRAMYKDPLATPATFSYNELMNAGVCMARADMVPEATMMFKAAYAKDSWHRDALSNLSIMLLRTDDFEAAVPLAARLVSVEPNNPENLQLLTLSYAGIARKLRETRINAVKAANTAKTGAKTGAKAAATKAAPSTANRMTQAQVDSLYKVEQAYTDSAVKTNERKEKLTYRVQLSDFTFNDEKATFSGSVTNIGTAEKPITIRVDFLDKDGKVVSTKEAALGTIASRKSARFSVTAEPGKDIVAVRYAPVE